MRYEINFSEDNKVVVVDTVTGASYYGEVVNGYARSKDRLAVKMISKALRQSK